MTTVEPKKRRKSGKRQLKAERAPRRNNNAERNPPKHVALEQTKSGPLLRFTVYLYPDAAEAYARFVKKYPRTGRQPLIRKIAFEGWEDAKRAVERWRKKGGALPVPERESHSSERERYHVYLKESNPEHARLIEYARSLPSTGELRQLFWRTALIRGASLPDIDQRTAGL